MALQSVRLTGILSSPIPGQLASGQIDMRLNGPLRDPSGNVVVEPVTVEVPVVNGVYDVTLYATDSAGTNPTNLVYRFRFKIDGEARYDRWYALPYAAGLTRGIDDLTELAPPGSVGSYQVNGSGAYAVVQEEGVALPPRTTISVEGAGATAVDDPANNRTKLLIPGGGSTVVQDEGTPLPVRAAIDFEGAGVTATDDAPNNRTKVTIGAGGSGGHVIYENGVAMTARPGLDFGAGFDVIDDVVNNRTKVLPLSAPGHVIQEAGVAMTQRAALNFGTGFDVVDDPANGRTTVNTTGGGGGGAYDAIFNVLDYGADPTGVADSSAAINATVAAATPGRGIVYLPGATYKCNNISLPHGVKLRGSGMDSTFLTPNNSTLPVVVIQGPAGPTTGLQYVGVESLTVLGPQGSNVIGADGIRWDNVTADCWMRDVRVAGVRGIGCNLHRRVFGLRSFNLYLTNNSGGDLAIGNSAATDPDDPCNGNSFFGVYHGPGQYRLVDILFGDNNYFYDWQVQSPPSGVEWIRFWNGAHSNAFMGCSAFDPVPSTGATCSVWFRHNASHNRIDQYELGMDGMPIFRFGAPGDSPMPSYNIIDMGKRQASPTYMFRAEPGAGNNWVRQPPFGVTRFDPASGGVDVNAL